MLIRRERADDAAAVNAVHRAAFARPERDGDPVEVGLVESLRAAGAVVSGLSFVAVVDGAVVGHVVCSRGRVDPDHHPVAGLGPLGVLPEHQRQGVGQALMHAVLGAAEVLGEPLVALLGDPAYYVRFGFEPSARHSIEAPDENWGEYFQVRMFDHDLSSLKGTFRYAAPFEEL